MNVSSPLVQYDGVVKVILDRFGVRVDHDHSVDWSVEVS